MDNISRKKFLRTFGSVLAGGVVTGVSGVVIANKTRNDSLTVAPDRNLAPSAGGFVSPYKQIAAFSVDGSIEAFEQYGGKLYVATVNAVSVFDEYGKRLSQMTVEYGITGDMAVGDDGVWLLRPASILLYSFDGTLVRKWDACSELSDYC